MTGLQPLAIVSPEDIFRAARGGLQLALDWQNEPLAPECRALCEACCCIEPSQRPSIEQVQEQIQSFLGTSSPSRADIKHEDALAEARHQVERAQVEGIIPWGSRTPALPSSFGGTLGSSTFDPIFEEQENTRHSL
mmetsp:Transcript_39195/g.71439  ORF Transcript_39195/g.71439 Transcript_39195/m.71439 type:complete len:136 (+) Transcript_39195:1-408(+)